MLVVLCRDPLEPSRPDRSFEAEVAALERLGLLFVLIDLAEGLVFREFVEFEPVSFHPGSGMPLTEESRSFWLDEELLLRAGVARRRPGNRHVKRKRDEDFHDDLAVRVVFIAFDDGALRRTTTCSSGPPRRPTGPSGYA